jgi:FkbM family methyltransferase
MMIGSRLGALLLATALSICWGAASSAADGSPDQQLEREFQLALKEKRAVTLDMGRAGEIKMFLNPDDPAVSGRILNERIWEPKETYWYIRVIEEGDTVVDIGANIGYYTLLGGALVGEKGRVFAFEPDPVAFRILERNVRLNGLTNVVLEQKAVSNEHGSIRLYLAAENKGDHKIYETEESRESIEIEAVSLDDYFNSYEGSIDFVKIDTQGAEGAIIEGMGRIIKANDDILMVVEFWPFGLHGFGYDSDKLLKNLDDFGFEFFNLGVWGKPSRLMRTDIPRLSSYHTVENKNFTNLFLAKRKGDARQSEFHGGQQ